MSRTATLIVFIALTLPSLAHAQIDPGIFQSDKDVPRVGWEVLTAFQDRATVQLATNGKTGVVEVQAWDTKGAMTHSGAVSFDDTGNLTLVFDWANFDDTGNLTRQLDLAAFDDTGNLTVGVRDVSFDDTGNLTIELGWESFDDTGNLTIDLDTTWKVGGKDSIHHWLPKK